ncbi:Cytokinin riboside 5'-monophosphate phosphoribohydrolase [compost metagenome]
MFFGGMSTEKSTIRSICVYCGSQPGRDNAYMEAGRALGRSIADHGLRLVYGGGTRGIMGAVASGVLSNGGEVTGIIPEFLMDKEATRHSLGQLNELIVTADMHERKHTMFERADAFVAIPGGIGTLEEIVEIMTWAQLGRHRKPMVFGNINNFWRPMLDLLQHMREEGFVHTAHLVQPLVVNDAVDIVPTILAAASGGNGREGEAEIISRL